MLRKSTLAGIVLLLFMCSTPLVASAFTNGEAASVVLGQVDFTHNAAATTQTGMSFACDVAVDSSGNVWVADANNNRVLEFAAPYSNGEAASIVLGQVDFTHSVAATTATGMNSPCGVAVDSSGNVWVGDSNNNRVLEYVKGSGFVTGQAASIVLGQVDFTHSVAATTATGMNSPCGVAVDSSGNVWVGDSNNNRVLEYVKGSGFVTGQAASIVLGQVDFTHSVAATTATGMNTPAALAFDPSGNLWVNDNVNNRVLEYVKGSGFTNGQAASVVLGQVDFTHSAVATTATGMNNEVGVTVDSFGNVWVSDTSNNRVTEFLKGLGFTNGEAASVVLGQADFTHSAPAATATGMSEVDGLATDGSGNVWVADSGNNRVLEFPAPLPTLVACPSTGGGVHMPPGATFTDTYGNTWVAPSGYLGGGFWSSYFFVGQQSVIPPPMLGGWGGVYGTYGGQMGWIVTFYC